MTEISLDDANDLTPPPGTRLRAIHRGLSNGFDYAPGDTAVVVGLDPLPYVRRESDGADLAHVSLRRWARIQEDK